MEKIKIFISQPQAAREKYLCQGTLEGLRAFAAVSLNNSGKILTEKEMSDSIKNIDGLITGWGSGKVTVENLKQI